MTSRRVPVLFTDAADCCGCGACAARCPKGAIEMTTDERGFAIPVIDFDSCIGCGACERACGFQAKLGQHASRSSYAAVGRGDIAHSSSGGVFATLARAVFAEGGVVFGAACEREDDGLSVKHIAATDESGLLHLQNSKYVQSDAGVCFHDVLQYLKKGVPVLFCGTPCQVAGLKGYLGHDWLNLFTADLVCHGVPSGSMFRGAIASYEKKYGSRVVDAMFRCKKDGWLGSFYLSLFFENGSTVTIRASESAYYDLFLKLKAFRDSCYSCPYASDLRAGDVTLGDFWGVEDSCPEVLADSARFDMQKGISCLLVNNERGGELVSRFGASLNLFEVSFDDVAAGNDQLRHPSIKPDDREQYIAAFADGGWDAVEHLWKKRNRGLKWAIKKAAGKIVPNGARQAIKKLIHRGRS